MSFSVRPYQTEAIQSVLSKFKEHNSLLLVAATGAGKTYMSISIAQRCLAVGKRVLFIVHRQELANQAIDAFGRVGITAYLEKAEHRAPMNADVVVASAQTLLTRKERFPLAHWGLVIADEAHHYASSDKWREVYTYWSGKKLAITATPHKRMGEICDELAYQVGLADLVKQGFLVRPKVINFPIEIDLSNLKKAAGDYTAKSCGDAVRPVLQPCVEALKPYLQSRRTLVFLPLVDVSKTFVTLCQEAGIEAKHVDGMSDDRAETVEWCKNMPDGGVMANCSVLTEGFDATVIDQVLMLRPTESLAFFQQAIGRGLRMHPGKEDCQILDPLYLTSKHSLITPAHLVAGSQEEAKEISEAIEDHDHTIDLEEQEDLLELAADLKEARLLKIKRELDRKRQNKSRTFDPIALAAELGDVELAEYAPRFGWETEPASPKQLETLEGLGVDSAMVESRGHASALMDRLIQRKGMGLCSVKQLRLLKQWKTPNAGQFTFEQASDVISQRFAHYHQR